ncbi:cupin domain-containing protein [Pseudazoarcus pumilus]|uniref:Cupin n=1 Tax=Pseudazoarcus pumilus TaxID=2067960 RepID=A0A2I6S8I5_9RHOO|nr:cupin domain-containing protein [Pseudazoarcus pumilus]AUN95573.1 cupin [Pseudazoarcus pumilus]
MTSELLGGITPQRFLAEYWQKKPLLIRQAIPGFTGVVDVDELFELACDENVESRLIRHTDDGWQVSRGPQKPAALKRRKQAWTVLVQGLNLWVREADALLHRFDFIPQARLDDLMVSYATDGGGIGAHFDSYDVFLLQGFGQRRWRIGDQSEHRLVEGAPLKLIADFQSTDEWVLEPGDMLYLPPRYAHEGTAIGECTTYSIGFRAPSAQELGSEFLVWLAERQRLEGMYADPDLVLPENSAEISATMVERVAGMLDAIRWGQDDVADFLGHYLSEPKPSVFFVSPDDPLSPRQFDAAVAAHGFVLDPATLLLIHDAHFYLNGERIQPAAAAHATLARLAHARRIDAATAGADALPSLYEMYLSGFGQLEIDED